MASQKDSVQDADDYVQKHKERKKRLREMHGNAAGKHNAENQRIFFNVMQAQESDTSDEEEEKT